MRWWGWVVVIVAAILWVLDTVLHLRRIRKGHEETMKAIRGIEKGARHD